MKTLLVNTVIYRYTQFTRYFHGIYTVLTRSDYIFFANIKNTYVAKVEVIEAGVLEPGTKIMLHDDGLGLEDGDRNGSLGDRRALWAVCNDEATRKARVTYHRVAEELHIKLVNL